MIFTLGYAKDHEPLTKVIDSCDENKITERINEATEYLLIDTNWKLTARRVRMSVCNGILALPPAFEKIITFTRGHVPGIAFSQHYEFLDGGPGRIDDCANASSRDLADLGGGHPTLREIDCDYTPLKLIAFSTEEEDAGKLLNIRGTTTYNDMVMTEGVPGENVEVNQWTGGIEGSITNMAQQTFSPSAFKRINAVIKPETKGYVTLYAYNPDWTEGDDGIPMLYFLAKYEPDETNPGYRWYRILNNSCCATNIIALVKLGYVPLKYDNDPLLIQSLPALKAMIQALAKYDVGEMSMGVQYESQAKLLLAKQLNNYSQQTNEFNVSCRGFGLGEVKAVI